MLRTFLTATVIAAAIMVGTAESQSQTAAQKPDITTELIVGDVSIDGDPFKGWVGVRVRLGPGWKIYWKAPGDTCRCAFVESLPLSGDSYRGGDHLGRVLS